MGDMLVIHTKDTPEAVKGSRSAGECDILNKEGRAALNRMAWRGNLTVFSGIHIPGREKSPCKGPGVGVGLVYWGNCMESRPPSRWCSLPQSTIASCGDS
jgi:hypothetical protein